VPTMTLPTVTLLASVDPLLRERAIVAARRHDPALVVVRHELTTLDLDGLVHRRVEDGAGGDDTTLSIEDGCCLSCLLRDDTAAVLRDLAGRRVLLVLPPAVEPISVATLLVDEGAAGLASIVAAVDVGRLEGRITEPTPLADIEDLGDDERSVAEVLARHLEHADTVLSDGGDDRALALLAALTGGCHLLPPDDARWHDAGTYDHDRTVARLQAGVPGCRGEVARHGVGQRCWHRRRPFHPQRLLDVLESGALEGLVRATGWLWVANRPGTVLQLDAVGGSYELGAVDAWLDAVDDPSPAHPERRATAERRWHPYYGDRSQDLALTTLDRDLDEVTRLLDGCLLTDAELAEGPDGWRAWHDPLSPWLGDEAELLDTVPEEPT
jgi:G3E family GTPase